MQDPDDLAARNGILFVDRVSEAEVVTQALRQHRSRIDNNHIDATTLRHVLTFYGEGGVGKTELSRHLAEWIGDERSHLDQWGPAPRTAVDALIRWDLNDSRGGLDPLPLLSQLRLQLGSILRTWPAFDLAFAAFHRVLRPGVELRLRAPRSGMTTLSEVLAGLTGDAAAATSLAVSGGVGAGAFALGRGILATAHAKSVARRTLRDFPTLQQLITDCEALSGSLEEAAALAGRIAFMLTEQVDRMSPQDRPMVLVFVDHMERLQVPGYRHTGEAALNRIVARLPYFLFIVTGRNSLRWHEPSPDLPASGGHRWPYLSPEGVRSDYEPRQHRIGHLSPPDAAQLLQEAFEGLGIAVVPGLLGYLADITDGWPLHLQTIVGVARERAATDRPLTADDLGGRLPVLVERLLSDLPTEVADAFRAACLLPYFDIPFVAAAGELHAGAVEQLVRRQLVRPNDGSVYPYRIHDTLRSLVRDAGSDAVGGWAAADWERHALLALAESHSRFEEAIMGGDDVAAIHSLALGLNVATENGVFDIWLIDAIRRSPSIQGLASLISADPDPGVPSDLLGVLAFLQLRARAASNDVTAALREIVTRRTAISSTAGLWRAYDLRGRGHTDEALQQLQELVVDFEDQPSTYRNQIVTTLRLCRRYAEAIEKARSLTDQQQRTHRHAVDRIHGKYEGAGAVFEKRVQRAKSRRFQVELTGDWLVIRHREHGVAEDEILELYRTTVQIGHAVAQAECVGVLAESVLFDEARFAECTDELEEISNRRFQPYRMWPEAVALRAWAIGDDGLARQAHDIAARAQFRSSSWTPTEILLEQLGHPLDPVASQWLEPYDVVRDRWLAVLDRIVQRAAGRI